jgi:integrase
MSREDYGAGSIVERSPAMGKRPARWQITVEYPPDPLTGVRRRRRFTVTGTRRDAQAALRKALLERDRGFGIPAEKVTVAHWLTRWLDSHAAEGHIGLRSRDRYGLIVRKHLIPSIGGLRLHQLRPDHIDDLKARWLSGENSTAERPLASATVHKHLVILHVALEEAVKSGVIDRNPMDAVKLPSVRAKSERRALSEEEIGQLLEAARGTRYDAPIRFALAAGVREGELLAARWEDLDIEAQTIAIRRSLIYVEGRVSMKEPKSANSRRTIELSEGTVKVLRAHRAAQLEHRLKLGEVWTEHGLIFPSLVGTPWLPRPFYRGFREVVAKSKIGDPGSVFVHTLRHTAASQWIRHGADVFTVSRRLGHAKAGFTMDVYGHLLKGQQRVAAEALDHLLTAEA